MERQWGQIEKRQTRPAEAITDITNEADRQDELSGLSEEGSVYDSEEDRKALKQAQKKRKAVVELEKAVAQKQKKRGLCAPNRLLALVGRIQC